MFAGTSFQFAFWILLAGLAAMQSYFSLQIRLTSRRPAEKLAGTTFAGCTWSAAQAIAGLVTITLLVAYTFDPAWVEKLALQLPDWLRWAGFALSAASLGLWFWAKASLQTSRLNLLRVGGQPRLVTTGPYAWVRHPLYIAIIGWAVGLACLTANWIFIIPAAVVLVALSAWIPGEERRLLEIFGEEYQEYQLRTGRFLPRRRRDVRGFPPKQANT